MTLAQLRDLLAVAHGPAVERVQRLPENAEMVQWPAFLIAAPYLPKDVRVIDQPSGHDVAVSLHTALMWDKIAGWSLDLTDPGTVNALRVGLALAQGLDPTDGAIWTRITGGGWRLFTTGGFVDFDDFAGAVVGGRIVNAPAVLAEPDSTRALVLAVESVLGASSNLVQAV